MSEHLDFGSLVVIVITFVLFVVALFVKGFVQDMLLEAGVFLVSVKLIIMAHKNSVAVKAITEDFAELKALLIKEDT